MFLLKVIFYVVICLLAPPNSMFFCTVYTLPCFKQLLLPATTWCYSCIVSQYIVLQFIACCHHRHCSHFSSFSLTYWHVDIVDPFSRLQCWHVDVLLLLTLMHWHCLHVDALTSLACSHSTCDLLLCWFCWPLTGWQLMCWQLKRKWLERSLS